MNNPNVQVSDTTGDGTSYIARYIVLALQLKVLLIDTEPIYIYISAGCFGGIVKEAKFVAGEYFQVKTHG